MVIYTNNINNSYNNRYNISLFDKQNKYKELTKILDIRKQDYKQNDDIR